MVKTMKLVFGVAALIFVTTPATSAAERVLSPDGRINVEFYLDDKGTPIYTVDFLGEKIIRPSHLGFELKDDGMITDGFEVTGVEHDRFDETWKPMCLLTGAKAAISTPSRVSSLSLPARIRTATTGMPAVWPTMRVLTDCPSVSSHPE